jgi:LAO/AO transport system kinase
MLLCEAAGFDVILVETVGVGQSETAVADLTDSFVVLMLPGAGDELQGIKKGILELADIVAVNKADDTGARASAAAAEYRAALHILAPASPVWSPPVLTVSGLTGQGLDDLWAKVLEHRTRLEASGELQVKRRNQDAKWMWALVQERLHERLTSDPAVRDRVPAIERALAAGTLSPAAGADEIASLLGLSG